ncbi:MAG TPA: (5-formylfuran-3-yl)methyl phosphate synthase [Hyphomicrobium sp.]|nr:(5-formylfuran-3-yl)methyl phosphate synthase [Hyphomicrobium sp.]
MIDGLTRRRPAFLASVTSADEASLALAGGADVIDCKDPSAGALGALPHAVVREVAACVAGRLLVSATVGDLPPEPDVLVEAASAMARTGIDIVKIGFFGDGDARPAIAALGQTKYARARLVAVLMADQTPDYELIPYLAAHGFAGVMLDTATKTGGRLTTMLPAGGLSRFVSLARSSNLMCGLAGSLRMEDIAGLASLDPDVLGFRGALCETGRASKLDPTRVAAIRLEIGRAQNADPAREKSVA